MNYLLVLGYDQQPEHFLLISYQQMWALPTMQSFGFSIAEICRQT
jgi:hypothetical protein